MKLENFQKSFKMGINCQHGNNDAKESAKSRAFFERPLFYRLL